MPSPTVLVSARSPLRIVVFCQSARSRLEETTYSKELTGEQRVEQVFELSRFISRAAEAGRRRPG
jgi:hypothetical protein